MGFNDYKMLTVMKAGDTISQEVKIKGGRINSIRPVVQNSVQVLIKRSQEKGLKSDIHLKSPVWAPVNRGDKLGELVVMQGEKPLGKFALVSTQDVDESNIMKRLWDTLF
jgi:D-alanyl-D-alanine carboxypeptidase (penicillin-binding protein 5/6)